MASLKEQATIKEYQDFVRQVYGLPNDRHFNTWDMLSNVERFLMRALKGIRKTNLEKTQTNLMVSLSWLMSFLNQIHVDIEEELWKRFPGMCSYCASKPCVCKAQKVATRQKVTVSEAFRPKTLAEFQKMFEGIYPSAGRSLEHAGIHLAEEMGELSETVLAYRGARDNIDFEHVALEAADLLSCFFGVFNSLKIDAAKMLAAYYSNNCHRCHNLPCTCSFIEILSFKS